MGQNNLLDFLQGASNSVASNVSAPVDGIAWLLRKAGLPIPTNPVGGSDWMAQRGLTAEPQNKIAGLLGESIGGVAPMLAAAKAPQIAKGLLQGADNLAAPRTLNPQAGAVLADYRGSHTAPMKANGGAPLHDLTQVYPDDIYSAKASQYYGHGDAALDRGTFRKVNAYKGNPDAPVTMYRAVPNDVPEGAIINNGDWVTINPDYARIHGEGPLNGNYRVLQQQVPARKLFTNGDSIHEFGYDESGKISPALLAAIGIGGGAALSNDDIRNKLRGLLAK